MPTIRQALVSKLTRMYPFYSGCGSFANKSLIQKLAGACTDNAWTGVHGGMLLAPMQDYVGRAAYYTGDLDRKITWICSRIVNPGDTVLDIGANIGLVTVLLSSLVGDTGHVHSFEPNPGLLKLLRQTIERNGKSNVKLHDFALGETQSTMTLRIPRVNAGAGSLIRNLHNDNCDVCHVDVRQLSQVIEEEKIKSINLLKIDVEGFEAQVFAGAHKMFETARPMSILFELNDHFDGPLREQPVIQTLMQYGYRFFTIPKCMVRMQLQAFDPAKVDHAQSHDFLAVAEENVQHIASRIRANLH